MKKDPFKHHKLALAPFGVAGDSFNFREIACLLDDEKEFWNFLGIHGLAPLWYETIKKEKASACFPPLTLDRLKTISLQAVALYLQQKQAIITLDKVFTQNNIRYAIFKGADIREQIYKWPAVRVACDIDVLISKADKVKAIQSLLASGCILHPSAENISHEVSLSLASVSVDLHWDILRPGRTGIDLSSAFLAGRKRYSFYWGPSAEATLFILLVHPVFTKYLSTTQASLIRIVDLLRWLKIPSLDFDLVSDLLTRAEVKTAAWATGIWVETLTEQNINKMLSKTMEPSALKSYYLRSWLKYDLGRKLHRFPLLTKMAFTLPVHDTLTGSIRATTQLYIEKYQAKRKLEDLLSKIVD